MRKYLYQRFLPDCDTDGIILEELYVSPQNNYASISIMVLDETVDSQEDLIKILEKDCGGECIVLKDDRPVYANPIISAYAVKTLKAYLFWITHSGYKCYWTRA